MTRFSTRLLSKPDSTKDDKSGKAKNDSPTKTSIPPWKSLFSFTTRHDTPLLIGAAIFSVLASAANPAQAFITGKIFNGFVEYATGSIDVDGLVDQQNRWILYLVGIACASWAFHFLEFAAWMTFGEIQAKNARTRLFDGLCAAEIAWYDLCEDGIQVTLPRLQAQIKDLQLATSQPMGSLLAMICTSLIAIGQAFYNSWDLTLVTLAGAPAIAFIIVYFSIGMEKAIDKQQQSRELAQKCALETYSNVETVKCFNAEELHLDQYRTAIAAAARWYRRIVNRNAWQMALLAFLIQAMFVQSFYYGGILIRNGKKQPAQVITTFFSAIMAFQALQGLVPQLIVLEKGRLAGKAVQAAIPRYTQEPTDTKLKPLTCKGNIHLRGVSFKYPSRPDQNALSCVNLVISGGELTFLIGRSGSGKSTIGQLLVQFYDADSGTILLDGTELCEIDRGWLRNNITLVEQNSVLFGGTVADNIALGSDQSNAIEVKAAAEFALLQGIMFDTPDGLATIISSTGESVSGGQRQRIALARARLRDTPILILDESTSALDQINRELMMDAIRVWRQDKTTIIVTHDISQILEDDYAVVMEHGKITQHGYRREMESRLDSPFCRLVKVGPSEDDTHKRASIIRQAVERPMSFLARAANALEWLPMTGLRASRTYPRRSETVYEEMQEDSRTLSKRLQDLLQDVGERAVATRTSLVARRRPQPDTVEEPIVRQDQAGLRPLLHRMWHDIPIRARLIMLLGCLGATIHGTCSPVFSYVLSKLLALYAQPGDTSQLSITYSLSILGIAAVDAFNIFLYRCSLETTSQLWVDTLRARASHKLVTQPQEFFEINTAERLTETLDRDAEEMRNLFGRFVIMMYIAAVILVVSFIWALTAQWKMTLLSMTAAPYIFVIAKLYTRVTEQWEVRSDKVLQEVNVIFSEAFTKVRTVRSLNLESHFRQRFLAAGSITFKIGVQRAFLSGFFYGLSTSAGSLATALVFYVGTKLVSQGASVNAIIQVFAILILTISNVSAILDYVPQMSSSKAMAWQMLRLAQLPGISHEQSGDTRIMSVGRIEFRDLDFSYPSRVVAKVLQGVNFVIEPGTTTAIVGGSGSGKSTIAKLLLKLYSASPRYLAAGFITVSGRDLTTIDTKAVRQMTAVVAQSARLFSMSIEENITYGLAKTSTHNSMDNVVMACQQAGIYEFVMSLPDAFKTMVGPGGIGLSGGQTQRLAIARALVRRPSLLILDEATSALDPESSILVKSTIRSLVAHRDKQMTILIITHNREMMDVADQILVLDHGCVVEKGGFNELLQRNGHLVNLLKGGIFE